MAARKYSRYPTYRINRYKKSAAGQPMSEINTTPLIDVLLVLLIMIIITIPVRTHKVEVDLPQPGPTQTDDARHFALNISAGGQIFWDGEAVDRSQLQERLTDAALLEPEAVIRFHPDPQASFDASVQVIALVGDAGLKKFAFIGNEQFRTFASE